jgi:hypothetical protein
VEKNYARLSNEEETNGNGVLISTACISRIGLQATEVTSYLADNNNRGHVSTHIEPLKKNFEVSP